jgi:SAM-dependent methyltransferase
LDSHTGLSLSSGRLYGITQWPRRLEGNLILEAGSGAGRFTEVLLSTGATVFSFDLSSAVDANLANNGHQPNAHVFQANIYEVPLHEGAFDKVVCLGVLQHTPDPETAFRSLVRQVKPGGELAIDVYAWRLSAILHWRFLLRPITRRLNKARLYRLVEMLTHLLLPVAVFLRRVAGRAGARLVPIAEHSMLGLSPELHRQWAILDTFDWYSPTYDKPMTLRTVRRWFDEAGFVGVVVEYGPNGIIGRGRRPA